MLRQAFSKTPNSHVSYVLLDSQSYIYNYFLCNYFLFSLL